MRNIESQLVKFSILKYKRLCYNRSFSGTGAMLGKDNAFWGKSHSEATRKIISESQKHRTGEKNAFWGRKHTEESKRKMSLNKPNTETSMNMRKAFVKRQTVWWCTPVGCFYSRRFAAKITGISDGSVSDRCKNADSIVVKNYQTPEEYWGKTWREVGYYIMGKIAE